MIRKKTSGLGIGAFFGGLFGGAIVVWVLAVAGWFMNLFQVIKAPGPLTEAATWTILLAIKVVGIVVPPIGALMGWIGLFA